MDAPGNQMRRATAILGAQRLYWDPEPLPERPHPLGELRGLLAEVASGWGRSGRGSGSQYSRWAPNIAVARRIWLPGASIMEDY